MSAELRYHMLRRKMSQAELSRRSGVSEGLVSRYLSGKHRPSLPNALKMADALKTSVKKLGF